MGGEAGKDERAEGAGGEPLRLLALDELDLTIVSAHLQDALVRRGDLRYLPGERRFVLALHRFDWERAQDAPPLRRLTALHFEQVLAVHHRNMDLADTDSVFDLLAIHFDETDPPSGVVVLEFAGGGAIRLDVECLEAQLKDLGPAWQAPARPTHAAMEDEDADKA